MALEYLLYIKTCNLYLIAASTFDDYILIASEFEQNQQERTAACNALNNSSEEGRNNK